MTLIDLQTKKPNFTLGSICCQFQLFPSYCLCLISTPKVIQHVLCISNSARARQHHYKSQLRTQLKYAWTHITNSHNVIHILEKNIEQSHLFHTFLDNCYVTLKCHVTKINFSWAFTDILNHFLKKRYLGTSISIFSRTTGRNAST